MTNTPEEYYDDSVFSASALAFIENQERDENHKSQGPTDEFEQEMKDVWASLDLLVNDDFSELAEFDAKKKKDLQPVIKKNVFSLPSRWGAVAAAVLIALILPISYVGVPTEYSVAKGHLLTVTLNDGSNIELSGNTQAVVQEGWGQRSVSIEWGSAFFSVTPNKDKPFSIQMGKSTVTVLGTAFSVYRKQQLVEVVVESGKVNLSEEPFANRTAVNVDLVKNQKAIVKSDGALEVITDIDVEREIAWRNGFVHFKQKPLLEIVERMGDFYDIPIYIRNSSRRDIRLSGVFKTDDLDNFLASLQLIAQIKVEHSKGGAVYLY